MKIFFTGATGFVGAHTAMAFMRAGHELRVLVRNPQAIKDYFPEKGFYIDDADIVVGDMCDKQLIKKHMMGCDAVFHAAAMVSLHPKNKKQVYESNVASIDAVIASAVELGIKNILYVSSMGALFQTGVDEFNEQTPLGNPKEAYTRSKRDCDVLVEALKQKAAADINIQISYPSGVFGPDDPKLNESNEALITFVTSLIPVTSTGIQCVDVRDVAKAHLFMLENPVKHGRYLVAGFFYEWKAFHAMLEKITGRKIFNPWIPGALFRLIGKIVDWIKHIYPLDTPIGREAMEIVTQWAPANSNYYLKASGEQFTHGEVTFTDTINWLVKAGHLPEKYLIE